MNRLKLHLTEGPRRRTTAISDHPSPGSREIRLTPDELTEYLAAKQKYEDWQRKLSQHRRCGWSW